MNLDEILRELSPEKAAQFRAKLDELKQMEERKREAGYDPRSALEIHSGNHYLG